MDESNSNYRISHKLKSPFKAYNGDGKYIFVSYKHKDADIIYPIIKRFHDMGFNIWYDEGLPYGENFDIVIPNKIEGATLFVNFITHECMACANDSEDYMIKESDIAQYLEVPILAIYPQPDVRLRGYYLTNYLKKQSIHKHEYGPNEDMFIDVCVEVFMSKGLNPNPIEEAPDDSLKTEVDETKPAIEEEPDDSLINNVNDVLPSPAFDYRTGGQHIYVAYSHRDSAKVFPDIKHFQDLGYNIWYDEGIVSGYAWEAETENAILNSSLFVVFISQNSVESRNVRNEIFLALHENIPIIPIYIEKTELKYGLGLELRSINSIYKFKFGDKFDDEQSFLSECICTFEKNYDRNALDLAISIHNRYNESIEKEYRERIDNGEEIDINLQERYDARVFFDEVSPQIKMAYIRQAKSIPIKLDSIGCELVNGSDERDAVTDFSAEEVENMAILEHEDWCKEKIRLGWKYGEEKDFDNLLTPYLVPWDDLPEDVKEYDRDPIRELPSLMQSFGLKVVRHIN